MRMLQWAHAAYLVLLSALFAWCLWVARRADADR
jgi:hypothetical protein